MRQRVLAIGLDGYEQSLGDVFMAEGELPCLARLRERSARLLLDHGPATRTGLAWEHVSTGRSPKDARRWAAVDFDADSYRVWHDGTALAPFVAALKARSFIFDPPYFDLRLAPSARGVMNWGAHDPGVSSGGRPAELWDEVIARFGSYPVRDTMYDIVWPSPERAEKLGDLLVEATELRTRAARWLIAERCPDWDLALVVAGELHSAAEAFWHGVDPTHPLHALPSAPVCADRLRAVYRATDALVGELVEACPDSAVVAFSMNGMGPNRSDVASMALLSELLYRHSFGRPLLRVSRSWQRAPNAMPMLGRDEDWSQAVKTAITQHPEPLDTLRRLAARTLPEGFKRLVRPSSAPHAPAETSNGALRLGLEWMPTELYERHWPAMRCFALPSFYDGRVRVNLMGRERDGMITPSRYQAFCDEIVALMHACRDLRTGEPVVDHVVRADGDPLALGPSEADLVIVWRGATLGFEHPTLGRIGPLPYRRTGGHTGPYGMAYFGGDGIAAGDYGVRSSFDVVPTMVELLGEQLPSRFSGKSMLDTIKASGAR